MRDGTLYYDEKFGLWKTKREKGQPSLTDVYREVSKLGERVGKEKATKMVHAALLARRELQIERENAEYQKKADAARAAGKGKLAKDIEEKIVDLYPGMTKEAVAERRKNNRKREEMFREYPEIQRAYEKFTAYKNGLLDAMQKSGFMSKEQVADLKDTFGYVPFNRVLSAEDGDLEIGGYEMRTTGLMRTGTVRKLRGSPKEINNILDNMAKLSMWMTQATIRNHAAREMIRGMRELKESGIEAEYTNIEQVKSKDERKHLVSYREDGKLKFFKLKDNLDAYAFRGTESVTLPGLRMLAGGADWLRKGVTLSPEFIWSQIQQDTFRAYVFGGLKNPAKGASKVAKSYWQIRQDLRKGGFGDERLNRLGIMGMYDVKPEHARENTEREFIEGEDLRPTDMAWWIRFGERNAEASDIAQRKAVFDQTMTETNGDETLAFWRASEVINFNRRGASPLASLARQLIPFQNAYMQGLNVMLKSLGGRGLSQEEKTKALLMVWGATARIAVLSGLIAAAMADDDDYMNQPAYVRSRFFLIPTGDGNPPIKIPMPADIGFLAKALPEAAVMSMMRDDLDSRKVMSELGGAFMTAIMGPNITPQIVKPLAEVTMNYSWFTGAPIVGMGMANRLTEDQYRESTSQLARLFGYVGISPLKADHMLRGYFGTLGSSALTMTDMAYETVTGTQRTDRELAEYPIAKALFGRTRGTGFKEDYYSLREDIKQVLGSIKQRTEQGDYEGVIELQKDNRRLIALESQLNRVDKTMKDSNKRIRQYRNATGISSEQKRRLIEQEQELQARLASQISRMRQYAYE
jgi:hypothetical protein